MSYVKKYVLLKDLPDAKAGTFLKYSTDYGAYLYPDKYGKEESLMFENVVSGNPDWFLFIGEEWELEPFQWSDVMACEWAGYLGTFLENGNSTSQIPKLLIDWKKKKQLAPEVKQPTPPTSNEKERIEVSGLGSTWHNGKERIFFTSNKFIPVEKWGSIRKAIEDTLNGIPTPSFINYSLDRKYTKEQLEKARRDAFEAGRDRIGGYWNNEIKNWKYPNLPDYLSTLNQRQ